MADIFMLFRRDSDQGDACLEYSYVPEGVRRVLQLQHGEDYVYRPDNVSDGVNPTHVQVYVANNEGPLSIGSWQFPPGEPDPRRGRLVAATVGFVRGKVVGVAEFEHGERVIDWIDAEPEDRVCPQPLP